MTENTNTATTDLTPDNAVIMYRTLDRSGKASVKNTAKARMTDAVMAGDLVAAQSWVAAIAAMAPSKPEPAPVDWAQMVADRIATLTDALNVLSVPNAFNGIPTDVTIDFDALPTGNVDPDMVDTLTTFKKPGKSGKRHDVPAFVAAAVAGTTGWQKVSVIHNTADDAPSNGAITACLNTVLSGKKEIPGVMVGYDEDGRLAAISTDDTIVGTDEVDASDFN